MVTYFLVAGAVVFVGVAVWYQVRTWNTPGRQISQNAPMDDPMVSEARRQHDVHRASQLSGGGPG
jgi:hypothetical protein